MKAPAFEAFKQEPVENTTQCKDDEFIVFIRNLSKTLLVNHLLHEKRPIQRRVNNGCSARGIPLASLVCEQPKCLEIWVCFIKYLVLQ